MNLTIIPERLKSLRIDMKLSQYQAADLIHVTQPAYQRYEAGIRKPSVQIVQEIAAAFHTSVSFLTGETDQKMPDLLIINKKDSPALFAVIEECINLDEIQLRRVKRYLTELLKMSD